jgi:hypothetical protein
MGFLSNFLVWLPTVLYEAGAMPTEKTVLIQGAGIPAPPPGLRLRRKCGQAPGQMLDSAPGGAGCDSAFLRAK